MLVYIYIIHNASLLDFMHKMCDIYEDRDGRDALLGDMLAFSPLASLA